MGALPGPLFAGEVKLPPDTSLSKFAEKEIGPVVYDPKVGSLQLLLKLNPHIKDPSKILEGTVIVLPDQGTIQKQREDARNRFKVSDGEYRISKGETLSDLARRLFPGGGRSKLYDPKEGAVRKLVELNPDLKPGGILRERQVIRLKPRAPAAAPAEDPNAKSPFELDPIASHSLTALQASKLEMKPSARKTNREVALTFLRVHLLAGDDRTTPTPPTASGTR